MNPIECLMTEHRRIERVLDALTQWARRVERCDDPPPDDLGLFVAWLRGYADAQHHRKEEEILFRAMSKTGMPLDDGPLGVMLSQHDEGRELVEVLAETAEPAAPLSDEARLRAVRAANDFADLLRAHIRIEDTVLYPMARARLTPATWDTIAQEFEAVEAADAQARAALEALGEELAGRYSF